MSSSYRIELDKWLSQLNVKADRVLDIGGSQLPVKGRTLSWDVNEYLIADLPNPHVGSPKADVELDLNFEQPRIKKDDKYDLVFCLEVFEYIWNPLAAFRTIADLLKHEGRAWVTFPTVYPHHQPIEDDSLRYMEGGIKKLADFTGLTVLQMIPRRPETDAVLHLYSRERMRAAKGFDHNVTGYICEFQK